VFSYGGGVQSTAALVLAAQGEIDFRTFVFANVGDDSESRGTLEYLRDVAMPYAFAHGIGLREARLTTRSGRSETLLARLLRDEASHWIPARFPNGAPAQRSCTKNYKINVISKFLRDSGATKAHPADVGLGISIDELHRAKTPPIDPRNPLQRRVYPLIDLRLSRADCAALIGRAGLPVPPKSSCWFCPFWPPKYWQAMSEDDPEQFARAVALDETLRRFSVARGMDKVYLHRKLLPLAEAVSPHRQLPMFTDDTEDTCESGFCMT
jgi:3'-phosphoadenosine 5'-phosphosulfate sulfotransferase (PAPS reductase)/FAD synthetase